MLTDWGFGFRGLDFEDEVFRVWLELRVYGFRVQRLCSFSPKWSKIMFQFLAVVASIMFEASIFIWFKHQRARLTC